ncbi:MAG: ABC transporter ATP-binding protein [Alphaproteobacteria bacterium]|nr:ABC transporter ATP-binding protein [Alphaproteobacteria bacterium]
MAQPDIEPLVRCQGLSVAYADLDGGLTRVVSDASFTIGAGEAIGIVGESGSGKSTLARALLGYRRAGSSFVSGSLTCAGQDLLRPSPRTLAALRGIEIAMVPQNPLASLTYHIRVGRLVEEVLRTRAGLDRRAARARMLELLDRTGLPEPKAIAERYPHQLSGGQRQRVVIAAALACNPRLLVLDEPTTALDKTTEAQVLALIESLRREREAALVLVTHDLNAVARACQRVLVMKDSRIVEDGPVDQVFGRSRVAYTRALLGSALSLDAPPPRRAQRGEPLLDVAALGFSYERGGMLTRAPSGRPTLDAIDLTVGRGEIVGVIGESGSGKTTLGHIVAGMIAPCRGAIRFDGRPLAGHVAARSSEERRRIQMVFQDPLSSLNPRMTVGGSLVRPMRVFLGLGRAQSRERATALLSQLGMGEEYLRRFPRQLSGGQQQRVAIARAFAAEPDLLICDEITSALDASIQAQVLDHLLGLQSRSAAAMLVITHDLSVIWKLAPRVVVLQAGRIVEAGETSEVFQRPRNAYTAALLEAATRARRLKSGAATGHADSRVEDALVPIGAD